MIAEFSGRHFAAVSAEAKREQVKQEQSDQTTEEQQCVHAVTSFFNERHGISFRAARRCSATVG